VTALFRQPGGFEGFCASGEPLVSGDRPPAEAAYDPEVEVKLRPAHSPPHAVGRRSRRLGGALVGVVCDRVTLGAPHRSPGASHTLAAYLQPGSFTVWPGGWHLAPPSFGPFELLPGPKSGSAATGAAGMASAPTVRTAARSLRLRMCSSSFGIHPMSDLGWTSLSAQ
jgi:hypothetical protein